MTHHEEEWTAGIPTQEEIWTTDAGCEQYITLATGLLEMVRNHSYLLGGRRGKALLQGTQKADEDVFEAHFGVRGTHPALGVYANTTAPLEALPDAPEMSLGALAVMKRCCLYYPTIQELLLDGSNPIFVENKHYPESGSTWADLHIITTTLNGLDDLIVLGKDFLSEVNKA